MLKYKIEVSLIKGARFVLGLFPIKWRFKSAEFLGILTYYLIKKRRNITYKNLNIALDNFCHIDLTVDENVVALQKHVAINRQKVPDLLKKLNGEKVKNKKVKMQIAY